MKLYSSRHSSITIWASWNGTVKLTDLRTCSAPWTLPKLLILH